MMVRPFVIYSCPLCQQPVDGAWRVDEAALRRGLADGRTVLHQSGAWVHLTGTNGNHICYVVERAAAPERKVMR